MGKKIVLLTAIIFALPALAGEAIFGNFIFSAPQDPEEIKAEQERQAFTTDSLLNTIVVDSLTRAVYQLLPPHFNAPRILGTLGDSQFYTRTIQQPGYTDMAGVTYATDSTTQVIYPASLPPDITDPIPEWFKISNRLHNQTHDASVRMMINDPYTIQYADWTLPQPPRLPKEDNSFHAFLKRFALPEPSLANLDLPQVDTLRKNWLHTFTVGLQVSQAYVSSNWYQGGNSYVAGLFNFNWNVELNTVYHPRLLFQSSVQYKLAVNSNPKGSLHKYNTSQDLFQYNLKTGLKAFNHWFYSFNLLFQTQFFNAYPEDSMQRSSSLLSPGTFNLGLGMTYSLNKKGAALTVSISPLAYNLKTCIYNDIDHAQFNIPAGRKTASEFGSSAEANLTWNITDKFSWKSRVFLFTDYHYFLADWENTLNFQFSKILSTQIFLHPRFDSSSDRLSSKWRYWMFHEILSFGISYTFATPK